MRAAAPSVCHRQCLASMRHDTSEQSSCNGNRKESEERRSALLAFDRCLSLERADQLAKDPRPDAEKVEELFLWAFARRPTEQQLQFALGKIQENAKNRRLVYEDMLWALINTKEFILVQ